MIQWEQILNSIVSWVTNTGIKLVIALLVLFVSYRIINAVIRKIEKNGEKKSVDKTILKTGTYVLRIALKVVILVCLIGYVGIDTSGITALIASFGVCIGLAVNGALSNIAGGVLLLVTRPFKVDDFIEAQGVSGTVTDIQITATKIITPDNKVIHVPNGALSSGTIINYSEMDTRRVDLTFAISPQSNPDQAKAIVTEVIEAHPLALKDPAIFVRCDLGVDTETLVKSRVWVKGADYWTVYFDILETVKAKFAANGIAVAAKQIDVNVKNG